MTVIDHLVVGAATLEEGLAFARRHFGVDLGAGGRHPDMATHNALLRLGQVYLEVIAVDGRAPRPSRPRWFELDGPWMRQALATGPRLLTWVVRARDEDFGEVDTGLFGAPLAMQRDRLRWRITVPADGHLPAGGLLPTVLHWDSSPAVTGMPDSACRLHAVVLRTASPAWYGRELDAIGAGSLVTLAAPSAGQGEGLSAVLDTPAGRVCIDQAGVVAVER